MAIFRKHKSTNFTTIDNNIFKNQNLSNKATGLLCLMLSLPDDWDFSIEGLMKLKKDNRSAIRTALFELEEEGYLHRERDRNEKGILTNTIYDIYEVPMLENQTLDEPKFEKPTLEKPTLENRTQLNTNNIKDLNKSNKEIYKENIEEIINYLNNKIDTHYRTTTPKTKQLIIARLNEGFKVDDFKTVIDNKYSTWFKDKKMCNYLRPETLFGTKFENYLNEKVKKRLSDEELINMLKEMDKNETK
jgi:uncharacterized phage protein (TIGR02220 family)